MTRYPGPRLIPEPEEGEAPIRSPEGAPPGLGECRRGRRGARKLHGLVYPVSDAARGGRTVINGPRPWAQARPGDLFSGACGRAGGAA